MKALLLSVILVIASCNGQKKVSLNDNEVTTGNQRLTLVLQDNYSGSDVEETLIIKDVKALRSFYSKINRTRKPGIPLPNIDFTKEIVLVHCSGEQHSGTISWLSIVAETDTELVLKTSIRLTKEKEESSPTITPFRLYKLPYLDKKITFVKER